MIIGVLRDGLEKNPISRFRTTIGFQVTILSGISLLTLFSSFHGFVLILSSFGGFLRPLSEEVGSPRYITRIPMVIDVLPCLIRTLMNEQKRAMGRRYVNGVFVNFLFHCRFLILYRN
ncbi:unnamed protein product [Linum tenue]|uniref:Uncharacterized protein n=1 Tax=Linum tenue TaxID=586396 RepID=A0AAV0NAI4_9ROSI|nr:unnamed protein product [Linum tenue]